MGRNASSRKSTIATRNGFVERLFLEARRLQHALANLAVSRNWSRQYVNPAIECLGNEVTALHIQAHHAFHALAGTIWQAIS
jgi:hypothetical protein